MAKTFAQIDEMPDTNATLIVDALNLCFRFKHRPNYNCYAEEFIRTVRSLARSYKTPNIIITADKGSSSYRKEVYPEYKADRKEKYKDQTKEEEEQFKAFFAEYHSTIEQCEELFQVFAYQGVEADDIAAHLVKHRSTYGLDNIWLVSSDGDWDLLISEDVSRFNWRTGKEVTLNNWNDYYEVTPEQFISFKCLTGDKSDNIPGVAQVGPKRASLLLEQYDSAFDIYDSIPLAGTAKYIQNVNNFKDQILTNYELMDLLTYCDSAIGEENLLDIRDKLV